MKHVKLFEDFINKANELKQSVNEKLNRRDLKEVEEYGFEASLEDDTIEITGENPFGDDNTYTFYWDGEAAWSETDMGGAYYHEPVTSPEELSDAMNDTDNWN
jgi:hypothetical protein